MTTELGTVLVVQQVAHRELHSAMPDAPVVPHRAKRPAGPRLRRTRTVTAAALVRVASRVSPA